jgi:hypothetical protein
MTETLKQHLFRQQIYYCPETQSWVYTKTDGDETIYIFTMGNHHALEETRKYLQSTLPDTSLDVASMLLAGLEKDPDMQIHTTDMKIKSGYTQHFKERAIMNEVK